MPPRKKARTGGQMEAARAYPGRQNWTLYDKYAPRLESELLVYTKTVARVRLWIHAATGLSGAEACGGILVLAGPPGVGKSTTAEVLCRGLGIDVVRWRDTHGLGGTGWEQQRWGVISYESQVQQFQSFISGAVYPALRARGRPAKPSLLLIDDLPDARYSRNETRRALRELAERRPLARPAILILSEGIVEKSEARLAVERLLGDAQNIEIVEFNPITEKNITSRLLAVARAEHKPVERSAIEAIAKACDGDLRRALASLDMVMRHASTCRKVLRSDESDKTSDLHAVGRLLRAKRHDDGRLTYNPEQLVEAMTMDPDACAAFVQFNCLDYFSNVDQISNAFDSLSLSDSFARAIFASGRDGTDAVYPEKYLIFLAARAVSTANTTPAPSSWRPVRKPTWYDVERTRRATCGHAGRTHILFRLDLPQSLCSRPYTVLQSYDPLHALPPHSPCDRAQGEIDELDIGSSLVLAEDDIQEDDEFGIS